MLLGGYSPVKTHASGLASENLIGGLHYLVPVALLAVIGLHIGYLHRY